MKLLNTMALLTILVTSVGGCTQESVANRGFSLPIGDAEKGRQLFEQHKCIGCHALAGDSAAVNKDTVNSDDILVVLGGTSSKVQTYGDLVTSVINPSHRLAKGYPLEEITQEGQSKMTYYNQVLTVEELVDLVTFLKSQYKLMSYPESAYPFFVYPG